MPYLRFALPVGMISIAKQAAGLPVATRRGQRAADRAISDQPPACRARTGLQTTIQKLSTTCPTESVGIHRTGGRGRVAPTARKKRATRRSPPGTGTGAIHPEDIHSL